MLDTVVEAAVKRRLFVELALVVLLLGSGFMIAQLKPAALPDSAPVRLDVTILAPGMGAEEVEQWVTVPIESALNALPQAAKVRSTSKTGVSDVTVLFADDTDRGRAYQAVHRVVNEMKRSLPEQAGRPEIHVTDSKTDVVMSYVLAADEDAGYDAFALRSLNERIVKPLLLSVEGVSQIRSFGGEVLRYRINVNPGKLLAYQLTIDDVVSAVAASQYRTSGGTVARGPEQMVVRGVARLRGGEDGVTDIALIPIGQRDGNVVRVSDIASVDVGPERGRGVASLSKQLQDGRIEQMSDVVLGRVFKQRSAHATRMVDGLQSRIATIEGALPEGVHFVVDYDEATEVNESVRSLLRASGLAFMLIGAIMALFLLNLRATVLVVLFIPVSLLIALAAMLGLGVPVNGMSLAGLLSAMGLLANGAVLFVCRMMVPVDPPLPGGAHEVVACSLKRAQAAVRPVGFAVMIVVAAFLPMLVLSGEGIKLVQPFAASMVLAVLASLLVAIMVCPVVTDYLGAFRPGSRRSLILGPLQRFYGITEAWLVRRCRAVLIGACALFLAAVGLSPFIGTEWMPPRYEGRLLIDVLIPPSARLETARQLALKLEQQLLTFPEVRYAISRVGQTEETDETQPAAAIEMTVGLLPTKEWVSARSRDRLVHKIAHKLNQHPGLSFSFSQPMTSRLNEQFSGVQAQLAIAVLGPDLDVLRRQAKAVEAAIRQLPDLRDVSMEPASGATHMTIRPDNQALARYGLSAAEVMQLVEGVGGVTAGQVVDGPERYDIVVRLGEKARNSLDAIRSLRLQSAAGAWVKLGDVAAIEMETGRSPIRHEALQRRVVVQANTENRDIGGVVAAINRQISEQVDLPDGYRVAIGGRFDDQQRVLQSLGINSAVTVVLMLLVVSFAFASMRSLLFVGASVPLAMIAGIFSLYLTATPLSVPVALGFMIVLVVAVLSGSAVVDGIERRMNEGNAALQSVLDGARDAFSPVFIMAVTVTLSVMPLIWLDKPAILKPLAVVVAGGAIPAAVLTLIVLPCFYPLSYKAENE